MRWGHFPQVMLEVKLWIKRETPPDGTVSQPWQERTHQAADSGTSRWIYFHRSAVMRSRSMGHFLQAMKPWRSWLCRSFYTLMDTWRLVWWCREWLHGAQLPPWAGPSAPGPWPTWERSGCPQWYSRPLGTCTLIVQSYLSGNRPGESSPEPGLYLSQ